jgi:hypothetical protein
VELFPAPKSPVSTSGTENPTFFRGKRPALLMSASASTYTVNDEAKTLTTTVERCTFPQWDGGGGHAVSISFPIDDEFQFTVTKPFPDPTLGPIAPHIYFKRAPVP